MYLRNVAASISSMDADRLGQKALIEAIAITPSDRRG